MMPPPPSSLPSNATIAAAISSSSLPSSERHQEEEEYEQAVAFLQQFHSRQATFSSSYIAVLSTSLGSILENADVGHCLEDVLASDFAVALCVDRNTNYHDSGDGRGDGSFSRMKKATTSKCLLDLDDDNVSSFGSENDSGYCDHTSRSSRTVSLSPAPLDAATDYYSFGYEDYNDNEYDMSRYPSSVDKTSLELGHK